MSVVKPFVAGTLAKEEADRWRRRVGLLLFVVVGAVGLLLLTTAVRGRHNRQSIALRHFRGLPDGVDSLLPAPENYGRNATWDNNGNLAVVAAGSGQCPVLPTKLTVENTHEVSVAFASFGGPTCTTDVKPWTSIVRLPTSIDAMAPLTVHLGSLAVTLPVRSR